MAKTAGRLWPNPTVVGLQTRLYSPGYVGPARWVLFEPGTRRAFSALGKDVVPDAISILAAAADGISAVSLVSSHTHVTDTHVESLVDAGLLVDHPTQGSGSLLSSFHMANVDYPFFDYGSPAVMELESQLLDQYAALWPPPPPIAVREGRRFPLPPVDDPARGPATTSVGVQSLAWILRTALGPIGEIKTRYVTCVRRTTPSGGSRHPTELAVVLGSPIGEIPPGTYTYDVASHALVAETEDVHAAYAPALCGREFGIVVRTRVARPMWRYRDLRALRPVLIDAGHVAELVAFLLARIDIPTDVTSPPVAPVDARWLDEPEVALVLPTVAGQESVSSGQDVQPGPGPVQDDGAHVTNPALVLRFGDGLHARVLWPSPCDVPIDMAEFLVLNHCLPSSRGDRDSSTAGIVDAVPGASPALVEGLRDAGALLPANDAEALYAGGRPWVRHEWYLALLAYLEAASHGVEQPAASRVRASGAYVGDVATAFRRRTSRAFPPTALPMTSVDEFLRRAFPAEGPAVADVRLAAWNVLGLESGLYRWHDGKLTRVGQAPTRDSVARNSAGQTAASAGALALWISVVTNVDRPQRYVLDLVDLGRLGQRVCLAATELEMAVFLTPAVHDRGTCEMVGLERAEQRLTYVFGLGARGDATSLSR